MTTTINWDLESIFAGGSQSPALAEFLDKLAADLAGFSVSHLPNLAQATQLAWIDKIQALYDLGVRLHHFVSFIECLVAQNVKDDKAIQLTTQVDRLSARLGNLWTELGALCARQDESTWRNLLADTKIKAVAFNLNEQRDLARQKMSPELESLANDLAANGYHAWDRLYGLVSGEPQVEFDGKPLSLGQLQNKYMDDPDRATRQRAFALFESTWAELAKPCAHALNSQAGFRLTLYKYRGWDSVLKEPLLNNRFTADTLAAMWSVIDAKSAKLLDFFTAKARLMGLKRLSWYDVHAPVGQESSQSFTYAQAADFVVDNIRRFNPNIADYCRMAVDQHWVESENRPGKRAGAFCTGFPLISQSRVFMTYNGTFNGIRTLAHELGHGYHSWVMRDLPYGARRYTMSVAETASTFNEQVVNDARLKAAADNKERLSLLAARLNDTATFLMDIRARFDFEMAFFAQRAKGALNVDELNALMLSAQQTAFKNGLADYHPLFWASKLHFYITEAPFYNFPYTFGYLFSNGVYAQAQAEGTAFKDRYIALLRDTGSMNTEDLARTHLGVDLTKPDFWETAVGRVLADVDEFTKLVDKV